jgi:hypothetical protein
MDTAEWTGDNAHPATDAHRIIHGYGMRFGITFYCTRRTGQETGGCFALLAGYGEKGSRRQIYVYPDFGTFASESTGTLQCAYPLTVAAGQTAILFNDDDFHR